MTGTWAPVLDRVRRRLAPMVPPDHAFEGDDMPCLIWHGCTIGGHGRIKHNGRSVIVHRIVWAEHHGIDLADDSMPENLHHRCERRACAQLAHLEPVAHADHSSEHHAPGGRCRRGHDLTVAENVYPRPKGGRECFVCRRLRRAIAREAKLSARAA